MIVHRVEQGTVEWLMLRLGIPTASNFDKIISPKKLQPSASQGPYMAQLVAEWALNRPLQDESDARSMFMDRGNQSEPSAFAKYELLRGVEVDRVGFITNDEGTVGCSTDGLVEDDGDLELKCPSAKTHINYLLNGVGGDYICQTQGRLWITGRRWSDFMSWHPTLPPVLVRFARDETFIAALAREVMAFAGRVAQAKDSILETGYKVPLPYSVFAAMAQVPISPESAAGELLT